MKINACYVNQEPDYGDAAQPDSLEWELCVAEDRIIGEIYLPSGIYDAPHPAVIICHGIPGINCNDDLAQALRRMGCVVIRLCHRGSWGSGGTYSFTHCIEDAVAACRWAREEGARLYHIDPDNVFLIGHSAGGSTAINASRQLPFLKGTAAYCFLDHAIALARRNPDSAREGFRRASHILRLSSFEDLWQDHVQHAKEWGFVQAAPYFRERNLLLIGGTQDTRTPPDVMLEPFWQALQAQGTHAVHQKVILETNHSLDTARFALADTMGRWVQKCVETPSLSR